MSAAASTTAHPPASRGAYTTQNELLMSKLMEFYTADNNLTTMLKIITGESPISLRIVDWFATNYAKKNNTVYMVARGQTSPSSSATSTRFKVYLDYKLKLKAYSKKKFDPFCRWDRIAIPYQGTTSIETTIGQLNFFKWAIENKVIEYIEGNYDDIEQDMNARNSTSKRSSTASAAAGAAAAVANHTEKHECAVSAGGGKTRKKREELSVSAIKNINRETVEIVVKFN